ncbi:hypothetical protein K435DRAFT_423390 [Dendrothele bispora CBS 962.96]|uniref:Uncharacterized protein n=1 Tax=Dendrothele bispora (strain CBS 962.96) TaxID=1314807 RepID=A0A4S8L551_DENBC|nr:hypothetical protein K435DRAFT_423390 [Dendrothele bispora CBS 962.96]
MLNLPRSILVSLRTQGARRFVHILPPSRFAKRLSCVARNLSSAPLCKFLAALGIVSEFSGHVGTAVRCVESFSSSRSLPAVPRYVLCTSFTSSRLLNIVYRVFSSLTLPPTLFNAQIVSAFQAVVLLSNVTSVLFLSTLFATSVL